MPMSKTSKAQLLSQLREEARQTAERKLGRSLMDSEIKCIASVRSITLLQSCCHSWGSEASSPGQVAGDIQDLPVALPPKVPLHPSQREKGFIVILSVLLGLATLAIGLIVTFFMLLASLNLDPGSLTHLAIMATGWPAIPICLFCGFRMICRPCRRSLRGGLWALVTIVLLWLSVWIDGGQGLAH
jgi:hypothetical protein